MGNPTQKQIGALLKFKIPQSEIDSMDFDAASKKLGELINSSYGGKTSNTSSSGQTSYQKKAIKRVIPEGTPDEDVQKSVDAVLINAYAAAKKELPEEDENSQTFGYAYGAWKNVIARKYF